MAPWHTRREMHRRGVHKQLVNRVIEPWCHINVVVTATDWANFYALRCHPAAQPEMRALAEAMRDAQMASEPVPLRPGEWHLPYVQHGAMGEIQTYLRGSSGLAAWTDEMYRDVSTKVSVARCARVSYLTHEGKPPNVKDDLKLYDRLVGSEPLHASPAEHQATPDYWLEPEGVGFRGWYHENEHGNLRGWRQYRKTLPNENVKDR